MLILDGIRVLDFTQYLAGPTVGRLMAEMGAEIIKIELAPGGDPSRLLPIADRGRSGYFIQQNRGKQSLALDLGTAEGDAIVRELIAAADVVLENFGPGVMEKKRLAWPDIQAINPRVVMASLSAYGRESPLAHKTGYDWAAQAFAGVMHMTGDPDGPPTPVGIAIADVGSGVHAFSAIGYALFHRAQTGAGQWLDISMVDCLFHMHDVSLQGYTLTRGDYRPNRQGSHHELIAPFGVFRGPRGYIAVLSLQLQWKNVCAALGRPDLVEDPRYATPEDRARRRAELVELIESWMRGFADDEAVIAALEAHRVPCAPVMDPVDAIQHPYFRERGMVREIEDPVMGPLTVPGFPLRFSAQPERLDLVAPTLGQHNAEVLERVLGYDAERIRALSAAGVLVSGER
ncbi:MAG: CoA transferase [Gammaproteobacteria bacterium]|nr:CoA transferase [Gammaproteobacteria bacterium]